MQTIGLVAAASCLFVLTHDALAQERRRVVYEIELDVALAMGPRVRTEITLEPADGARPGGGVNLARRAGAAYWNRPYIYWTRGTYDAGTIIGSPAMVADAPVTLAARPSAPTVEEIAVEALRDGRYDVAAAHEDALRAPGSSPSDRLIVATEGAGRTGRAAALLVERVIAAGEESALRVERDRWLGAGEGRRAQRLAAAYAADAPDPNSWVLLASHLLGRGQREAAWGAIEKGIAAGLDPGAAAALESLRPASP